MTVCVVRALAISQRSVVESDCRQLGHRFFPVLFPSPGEPHRLVRVHAGATEDDSRYHYAFDSPRVFDFLSGGDYGVGFAFIVAAGFFIFHKW